MTAGQRSRCSTILASVCCLVFLVSEKGQAFLTPAPSSCFQQECATSRRRSPEATATATATTTAALTHDEARAAVAATPLVPSSPPILIESLAASPGQVDDAPGQWSPVRDTGRGGRNGQRGDDEEEEDFNINVGRAMDYLAIDVKGMFSVAPRLEIFTPEVRLKDPVGELCHGRRLYGALHTSLRVFGAITTSRPRVSVTSLTFNKDRMEIELKWTMAASAPFMGDTVKLSAVSLYRVDKHGLIYEHTIDNRIKRDLWEYSHSWMRMVRMDSPPSA
ncbi:unnamed protein product [Pylaiella littoralis]